MCVCVVGEVNDALESIKCIPLPACPLGEHQCCHNSTVSLPPRPPVMPLGKIGKPKIVHKKSPRCHENTQCMYNRGTKSLTRQWYGKSWPVRKTFVGVYTDTIITDQQEQPQYIHMSECSDTVTHTTYLTREFGTMLTSLCPCTGGPGAEMTCDSKVSATPHAHTGQTDCTAKWF